MTESLITTLEQHSAVWTKLKEHYEARLASLRRKNDGNLSADETAKVRGQIAEVKALLALDKSAPAIVSDETRFKD